MNMTTGNVRRIIISFALPIFISQLFQQLYNTADALIVGNLLGKQALAAVSSSAALIQLFTSLMAGVALGAGVVISRYFGAKDYDMVSKGIHTTVAFALIAGVFMTLVGVSLSPLMLRWMGTTPDVLDNSIVYFRNYFLGSLAVMLYNAFTGIMNALGNSKRSLYYLIFSSVLNIVLDLLFIGVFHMGVGSAAVATVISQAASALMCFSYLHKPGTFYRVRLRSIRIDMPLMKEVVRMGLPTGIQNSMISIGNVMVQRSINSFGTDAIAAFGSYSKLQGFGFLPIMSFVMALTTFTSQNLGAKQYDRAKQGARFGLITMLIIAELIGVILTVAAPPLVRLFNDDPNVVRIATTESHIQSLFFFLLAFSHGVAGICRGAGKAVVPMTVMLSVWCVLRIIFITIGIALWNDIRVLFWCYPLTWFISSTIFLIYFLKSDWIHGFEHKHVHHRLRFHHS